MAVEYINPNYYNQVNEQVKVKSVPKTHVVSLSKLEKLIYLTLVSLIAFVSIYMLSLKYDAYQMNTQIAAIEGKIVHQQSVNGELNSEVMKQSSYERVYSKAKSYGLSLKNDNVKVVQKDVTK
ncbi:cell division protein FtsL [Macrococcoides caseolyticum]|uniref:cell division protein FtsL n=1 Tax=Macrococcoides caseolyticum TaxID=69966 RepID=UPI000C34183F|nr:cell division protein FtsL [Macrococcus caseolyticus]PKE12648.1 cell division protein FtsL [Macrococcus caseolyticus]PKE48887.1 cell division protein FtsL [Macrococcus caseolyticus]PKF15851.1 cell division protein FtsL [Macrococcus caseolyticus]PNZ71696.1 cell division protein FtsL [Macrococcus caseolyticus]QPT47445.1 cell division protein FtsL [Macrococcus caseolyticus]